MQLLFKTSLDVGGSSTAYEVFFKDEAYHFQPISGNGAPINLRREEDEWKTETAVDEKTKGAAAAALDAYLLSQH